MNPKNCAFRVSSDKFLGFYVHQQEIDIDLDKNWTIAMFPAPNSNKKLKVLWESYLTYEDSSQN